MPDLNDLAMQVIQKAVGDSAITITDATPLVGDGSILDSMKLVEVCLALEDLAEDHNFEFDWTSEVAMSKSRGMFRTAGTLVNDFCKQAQRK